MTESISKIVAGVNDACDEMDFVRARGIIEVNLLALSEGKYYRLLNTNAKVLIKHVIAAQKGQVEAKSTLTRTEILTINKINEYCTNFDISMLKRTLMNAFDLVQRPDVLPLLNNDARIILDDMGALLGANYQVK